MAIRIINIHKSFGPNHVLKGIDFEFHRGQVNMIIGASGSGKSVLVKTIVGLLKPDKGEIWFDNLNLLEADHQELRDLRSRIGMLFQGTALFDSMTVGQNVGFPLKMFSKLKRKAIEDRVQDALARVNLPDTQHLYPAELSGGMRKRVGIARAIVQQPDYLFFDEPNSGLDPETAAVIDELIRSITQELNTTSVVISHDIKSLLSIADHVMFLARGEKSWEGKPSQIHDTENDTLLHFIRTSGVDLSLYKNRERN